MNFSNLTSSKELRQWCDEARKLGRIGLDTEFLWERTYAPQLCLVQMAVGDDIAIADPLEDIDLSPLADIIADPDVQTIMHAPHADLVAFAVRFDVEPSNVFDTQIAAGFVGLSAGLSYERLLEETLGKEVSPSESFTDWAKRPLNSDQLRYAAEDVEHLFEMTEWITSRLEQLNRLDWARDEFLRRFETMDRLVTKPEMACRKVSRRTKLRPKQMGVLEQAAAWREQVARERDMPTSWVVKDATLIEIARRNPINERELKRIRGIDGSIAGSDAQRLLSMMETAEPLHLEPTGESQTRVVRQRVNVSKGLAGALMRTRCDEAHIAPELVGTSSDVEEMIAHVAAVEAGEGSTRKPALLNGWRRELIGEELVELLNGDLLLQLSPEEPYLLVHEPESVT